MVGARWEGPGVNIYRTPLNGRNFEYFGEDPFLGSAIAVGYIRGVQSEHVAATVKHFLGNNSEFGRHSTNSVIDERALREMGPVAEKALLAVLDDPDPFLCEAAIKILKDIGTQQSVPALQAATAHIHAFVQISAREALAAIAVRTKK